MGQIHFVLSNIFAAYVAFVVADAAMTGRESWRRMLAMLAGFPVVVLFVVLALGIAGMLSAGPATVMVGMLALAGVAWRRQIRSSRSRAPAEVSAPPRPGSTRVDEIAWPLALTLILGFGGAWIARLGFAGTHLAFDDFSYHAPVVAHWIVDSRLSLAPFNYHAYFPFNAEVLALWFMLPFRADGLASLAGLYWAALLVAASVALVVAQGKSLAIGLLVGALLLASPVLLDSARSIAAVDLAGPALILAAIALSVPTRGNDRSGARWMDAGYVGLLAGFATGCKISFAPVVLILFLHLMFGSRGNRRAGARWGTAAIFIFAAAATGSYWYGRNWLLTGNPVFPAALGPFAGPFGDTEQYPTKLVRWIADAPTDMGLWLTLIKSHVRWSTGLFLLAAAGYGAALWQVVRPSASAGRFQLQSLLLLVGLVMLLVYPFMPFTGTYNEPNGTLAVSLRYLIAPFAIGIVLFASIVQPEHRTSLLWLCVAAVCLASTQFPQRAFPLALVVAGAVAMLARDHLRIWTSRFWRGLVASRRIALPASLIALALWAPFKQRLTDAAIFATGVPEHPIGRAWLALERLPAGSRVAWFGPNSYQYYPSFGRRLQLVPVTFNEDGSPFQPMHELFRRGRIKWWGDESDLQLNVVVPNLLASGVSHVLVSKWNLEKWPQEQAVLEHSRRFHMLYDDGYSVLWKVRGGGD